MNIAIIYYYIINNWNIMNIWYFQHHNFLLCNHLPINNRAICYNIVWFDSHLFKRSNIFVTSFSAKHYKFPNYFIFDVQLCTCLWTNYFMKIMIFDDYKRLIIIWVEFKDVMKLIRRYTLVSGLVNCIKNKDYWCNQITPPS